MEHFYREQLWDAWVSGPVVELTDIPVAKAQLMGRVNDFDGGRTGGWMASLKNPTWRAVRCAHSGHSIHCVSDRPFEALTRELQYGLHLLAWMSQRTPIVWYWWDQPWPRLLPAMTEPQKEHLNGGWAVPHVAEVHVYRREEAHKVLLHETIHALGLDVSPTLVDPVRARFEEALGRSLWPHLGEAFTELFAEWLWTVADAYSIKDAKKRWDSQLKCSEHQAASIWRRIRTTKRPEDTNVFAYYILKWVLMQHLEEVLFGETHALNMWFEWWTIAQPRLDAMAQAASATMSQELTMGMTCHA